MMTRTLRVSSMPKGQRKGRKSKRSTVFIVAALVLAVVVFTALYVFGVFGGGFLFGGNSQGR